MIKLFVTALPFWLYMLFCIPALVLDVTAHLNYHRGSTGWAAGLHSQQILPLEPRYLGVDVPKDDCTDIQDTHLVKFAAFVFAALACDWLLFCPAFSSRDHAHIAGRLRMGSRIRCAVGPSIQVDPTRDTRVPWTAHHWRIGSGLSRHLQLKIDLLNLRILLNELPNESSSFGIELHSQSLSRGLHFKSSFQKKCYLERNPW